MIAEDRDHRVMKSPIVNHVNVADVTDNRADVSLYEGELARARTTVTDSRYIVIRAVYDRYPRYGRSLEWIAPELANAGLTMTEDHIDEPHPSRTWAGVVDRLTFERFADAWQLDDAIGEPASSVLTQHGPVATRAHTFDGMNWEVDGESPIVCVSVEVGVIREPSELVTATR